MRWARSGNQSGGTHDTDLPCIGAGSRERGAHFVRGVALDAGEGRRVAFLGAINVLVVLLDLELRLEAEAGNLRDFLVPIHTLARWHLKV